MARESFYKNLTEEQVNLLQQFSKVRTLKKSELSMLEAHDGTKWHYNGCYDTGFFGGGRCSNGHKLRYVYEAINDDGVTIQFGEKCITEFFNVSNYTIKFLKDGLVETSKLIKEVVKMVNENENNSKEYKEILSKIDYSKMNPDYLETAKKLLSVDLPIPYWIGKEIKELYKAVQFRESLTDEQEGILVMAEFILQEFNSNCNTSWDAETLRSLMGQYEMKNSLSEKQMELLAKIVYRNCTKKEEFDENKYNETLEKINKLLRCRMNNYENDFIRSLFDQLIQRRKLSDKQMEILEKKMYRYRRQISELN